MAVTGFVYGTLAMGRVDRVANCSVVTQFRMLNGIPTYILDSCLDVAGQLVAIPRHRRSVVAGILRSWLFFLAVGSVVPGLLCPQYPWLAAIPALFFLAGAYSWLFYGLLTASQKRMRMAYATWLGAPFDPAVLPADWPAPCLEALCKFVDERAPHAPMDYRMAHRDHWRMVATESDDPEFLIAACTRVRFARRGATQSEQIEWDALHAAMWRKLDPMLSTSHAPAAFRQWQEYVGHYEKSNMVLTPRLAVAGTGALVVCGIIGIALLSYGVQPELAIVNATQSDGLTVLLDGKPIAERLPRALYENDAAFRIMRVRPGQHEFITQDATGREIDRQTVVITDRKHKAVLYAPARSIDLCFYVEKATYGSFDSDNGVDLVKLDMTKSLHLLEVNVNKWFEPPPIIVFTNKRGIREERSTVRALPCDLDARQIRE